MCRSGGPAGCSRWTHRPITTNRVAPDRPASNNGSRRSARRACATAIGAFTCCCAARAGRINQKKTRRIYRELGLQLRNKTPKRRVKAKLRDDRRPATRSNETWAMDFVHDQLATGQKLRVLTIVDTFSRFSPALEPRFTFRGADVVEVLERVGRRSGIPGDDPGRSGHRVRVTRSGSVGLSARRHARLLSARQADRQCVHRSVQRPLPSGMSERALVPEPCRCPEKVGGLAQSTTTRNARMGRSARKTPITLAESRWRSQPAIVKKPENSTLRRSRKWSHRNVNADSTHRWMKKGA